MFILVEGMVANADVRSDLNLLFGFNGKHINSKPIVFDSFIRLVSMMFVFGMMFFFRYEKLLFDACDKGR